MPGQYHDHAGGRLPQRAGGGAGRRTRLDLYSVLTTGLAISDFIRVTDTTGYARAFRLAAYPRNGGWFPVRARLVRQVMGGAIRSAHYPVCHRLSICLSAVLLMRTSALVGYTRWLYRIFTSGTVTTGGAS